MKALPDDITVAVNADVEETKNADGHSGGGVGGGGSAGGAIVSQFGRSNGVIEVYSSQSESEGRVTAVTEWCEEDAVAAAESSRAESRGECYGRRRKSKRKHKKRHRRNNRHDGAVDGRERPLSQVNPIFLWAQKEETKIVRVVCENLDSYNRIRLVKENGVWTTKPKSNVLGARIRSPQPQPPSPPPPQSVRECKNESSAINEDAELIKPPRPVVKKCEGRNATKRGSSEQRQSSSSSSSLLLVDVNDNSIDFVDAVCSEEDEDHEQRARIDRALEMIDRDPALLDDVKITLPPSPMETAAAIKLPEGTTIHQVKAEHAPAIAINNSAVSATPPAQCSTLGELTIIPQQQNEPLNLETVGKRSALEIRLQQPPLKKKRVVVQSATAPPQSMSGGGGGGGGVVEPVKREFGPLSELKEVLADPRLCVPDPLLVPRARLAALVASPATEIPKLLQNTPSVLPPVDPDLLTVPLSHLRSIVQQQPDFMAHERNQPSNNIDHMLWYSYFPSKEVDADLLLSLLSSQQSFDYPHHHHHHQQQQQRNNQQWNDVYYGGNLAPVSYDGSSPAGYNSKSDDCCASVSPLSASLKRHVMSPAQLPKHQQQQQQHQQQSRSQKSQLPSPSMASHHKSRLPPPTPLHMQPMIKQRVCRDVCCNNSSPPSSCYDSCCSKGAVCNPFVMSPTGCNPFVVSPTGCNPFAAVMSSSSAAGCGAGNAKTSCTADGTACYFPMDIGCGGYDVQQPSPSMPRKHMPAAASPSNRVQCNNAVQQAATDSGGQPQQHKSFAATETGGADVGCNAAGQCLGATVTNKPQLSPAVVATTISTGGSGGDAACARPPPPPPPPPPPLQKPKIKVKEHLIDPNAKPKLLNIEGALHLAGANPQDLLSSPLWHPLFGSQEKRYGCRWQWTTPAVTTPSSTSSENASSDRCS